VFQFSSLLLFICHLWAKDLSMSNIRWIIYFVLMEFIVWTIVRKNKDVYALTSPIEILGGKM
jgi:hypothetical protein